VCSVGADGAADACDPVTNTRIRVSPVAVAPPPSFEMPVPGIEMRGPDFSIESSLDEVFELDDVDAEASLVEEDEFEAMSAARAAAMADGAGPAAGRGAWDERMEVVFERCAIITAASDVRSACAAALTVLAELVPADAGCVLVRTHSGRSLRFAAAFGPRARKVIDTAIPVDQGIAGFAHGFAMGVLVEDASMDDRHYDRVDRASGYRTRSLIAVPLVGQDGQSLGCMELLNSPTNFTSSDLEVAGAVAHSLAEWLAPALL
jgi:hypothetical protein